MQEYSSLTDLLYNCRYATYATVNEDGSPHNSPMFYIPDSNLDKIYLGTHPDSLHAKNMARTGQAFAVIFGRLPEGGTGLYFKIEGIHEAADNTELQDALNAHNVARNKIGKKALPIEYYEAPNPQRMYVGNIVEISTNGAKRGDDGRLTKDTRFTIEPSELIAGISS